MALTYENLRIAGYDVEKILACHIQGEVNNHTQLQLEAILKEKQKDEVIHTTQEAHPIEVYGIEEGEKITLFYGVVTAINIHVQDQVYILQVEAKSYTYLMDIEKKSRSFQNLKMTYHQVIKEIVTAYSDANYSLQIPNEPIGELLVQYEETDWEFIKRIASQCYEGLYPATEYEGIHFYVGLPQIPENTMDLKEIRVKKDLKAYYEMKAEGLKTVRQLDYIVYFTKTEEVARLGHYIETEGRKLYVKNLKYQLEKSVLKYTYELGMMNGLKQKKRYPMHLIGVSLEGKILEPQGDKVKIHLKIDKKQDKEKSYWFPYSTMAASKDGSGWYCMPEVGDTVRVYFPTKYTKEAFAISSVSVYDLPQDGVDRMGNPDVKYLRTIHDKEVRLAPEGILIASNGNQAVMKVNRDGSISLYANKNIKIVAEEDLHMKATEDFIMTATDKIELACDKGGKLVLDEAGNVVLRGTEVKVD